MVLWIFLWVGLLGRRRREDGTTTLWVCEAARANLTGFAIPALFVAELAGNPCDRLLWCHLCRRTQRPTLWVCETARTRLAVFAIVALFVAKLSRNPCGRIIWYLL